MVKLKNKIQSLDGLALVFIALLLPACSGFVSPIYMSGENNKFGPAASVSGLFAYDAFITSDLIGEGLTIGSNFYFVKKYWDDPDLFIYDGSQITRVSASANDFSFPRELVAVGTDLYFTAQLNSSGVYNDRRIFKYSAGAVTRVMPTAGGANSSIRDR